MKKSKNKNPNQTFHQCPCCGSKDLVTVEIDVLCTECSWDSLEAHISAGALDQAIDDYFSQIPELEINARPTKNFAEIIDLGA